MNPYHKFNAVKIVLDGIIFPSKKEGFIYENLKLRQIAGEIIFFLRQVPFHLPGNIRYFVDFVTFNKDGTVHFLDAKGMKTPLYKLKKKQVETIYPIEIEEV